MKTLKFLDTLGTFQLKRVNDYRGLYFPLMNKSPLKSSITPRLSGDLKTDHHHFILSPSHETTLHELNDARYVWISTDNQHYNLSGTAPLQRLQEEEVDLEAGLLYHTLTRKSTFFEAKITSFMPFSSDAVEYHTVTLKNTDTHARTFRVRLAIPLYGRSADNLRDHRHVTALLHRAKIQNHAVVLTPTLSFDERGHLVNQTSYGVKAWSNMLKPEGFELSLDRFSGNNDLSYPEMLTSSLRMQEGDTFEGGEVIAVQGFLPIALQPHESVAFSFVIATEANEAALTDLLSRYETLNPEELLEETKQQWQKETNNLTVSMVNHDFSSWYRFVALQPILRRHFGCSFLPHHDYGKGGRGWRDLWQDLLSLFLMDGSSIKQELFNNFGGVRLDGSNATIIGDKPGEFKADRNNIVRVWSDHAAWPLLTTMLYVHASNDLAFLLEKQHYFSDQFCYYTKQIKTPEKDLLHKTASGEPYKGSLLEHLLIQNLVAIHNLGKNGNVRLEDADWNDAMDMAHEDGETVAFTFFYAKNLKTLIDVLEALHKKGIKDVELFDSLSHLLTWPNNPKASQSLLETYFKAASLSVSQTQSVKVDFLIEKLDTIASSVITHLLENEWVKQAENGYFNSYYDAQGVAFDKQGNSMSLIGQTFALLSKTLPEEKAIALSKAAKDRLYVKDIQGYVLNTIEDKMHLNRGRQYGFAYGHKENGAMFSHMAMMYAYGLYEYNLVNEGREVWHNLYCQTLMTQQAQMYPGIPEYLTPEGRGMYPYLTGSASWFLLMNVQQVFGLHMQFGSLYLVPKLTREDFIDHNASIHTWISGEVRTLTYHNPHHLTYGEYCIEKVVQNGKVIALNPTDLTPIMLESGDVEVTLHAKGTR